MSSLDHDRLPEEGAAPAGTAAPVSTPARATTRSSRTRISTRSGSTVPPPRQGRATTATGKLAARTKASAKAAAHVSASVAVARTAVARAVAPPVAADASVAHRPTPYPRASVDLAALADVTDLATLPQPQVPPPASVVVLVKEAPAPSRSAEPAGPSVASAGVEPAAEPAALVEAVARGRLRLTPRRPGSIRGRSAVYLAAALVGVLSSTGAAAGPSTQVAAQPVSHSVSVAEELGIESVPPAVIDEQATSRLRQMVASRTARDAERTAAADAQAEADRRATEEAARAAAEAARPKAVHPVEGARLTSGFGARWGTLHPGIDLAAPMRTPERAVMDGVVLEAGPASGFGLVVYIQHDNGDVTVYGHMDEILVEPGQVVRAGDTIALLGNRGQSTGPHLHFEVHVGGLGGEKVDPLLWLRERGIQI